MHSLVVSVQVMKEHFRSNIYGYSLIWQSVPTTLSRMDHIGMGTSSSLLFIFLVVVRSTLIAYVLSIPSRYVFSTEGHLLPASPEISLVNERCSYLGAFCWDIGKKKHGMPSSHQEINNSRYHDQAYSSSHARYPSSASFQSHMKSRDSSSGFIKASTLWLQLFCFNMMPTLDIPNLSPI